MDRNYIAKYYYYNGKVYLQEFGIFNVVPIWGLIKFATFVGSTFGPFKGFFRPLGMGIGILFSLGTVYKVIDSYVYKIKFANGVLKLLSVLKSFLVSRPSEVAANVEVEKLEKAYEEEFNEESENVEENKDIKEKKETKKSKKEVEKFLLEQGGIFSSVLQFFRNLLSKCFQITKLIPFQRAKRILLDFLSSAKNFISSKLGKTNLLEFKFIKNIFSNIKGLIGFVLGITLVLLFGVFAGSFLYHNLIAKVPGLGSLLSNLLGKTDKTSTHVTTSDANKAQKENEAIQTAVKNGSDNVKNGFININLTKIFSWFANAFRNILNLFKNLFSKIKSFFSGKSAVLLKESDVSGAGNTLKVIGRNLMNVADKVILLFKSIFKKRSETAAQ